MRRAEEGGPWIDYRGTSAPHGISKMPARSQVGPYRCSTPRPVDWVRYTYQSTASPEDSRTQLSFVWETETDSVKSQSVVPLPSGSGAMNSNSTGRR